jgi:hypothetical protein
LEAFYDGPTRLLTYIICGSVDFSNSIAAESPAGCKCEFNYTAPYHEILLYVSPIMFFFLIWRINHVTERRSVGEVPTYATTPLLPTPTHHPTGARGMFLVQQTLWGCDDIIILHGIGHSQPVPVQNF